MNKAKNHFVEMDGLRGVAALAVSFLHLNIGPTKYFGHSYLAVDFFFMLSGFILMHAYGERLSKPNSFIPFVRSRLVRLYPMLILGAFLGFVESFIWQDASVRDLAVRAFSAGLNGLGLPLIWNVNPFWINVPSWSLFFELVASIAFGLTATILSKSRTLWTVAGISVLLLLIVVIRHGSLDVGSTRATLAYGLLGCSRALPWD